MGATIYHEATKSPCDSAAKFNRVISTSSIPQILRKCRIFFNQILYELIADLINLT